MSRTQYINHEAFQKMYLSPIEASLMLHINSRPNYCLENLSTLAYAMKRSIRTVQRAIQGLLQKGLIKRKYTNYKRLILTLVSMDEQKEVVSKGAFHQIMKFCNFAKSKKKSSHTTLVSGLDTTSVSESINISNKKKSILNTGLKIMKKGLKSDFELALEKQRQLAAYKVQLGLA